MSDNFHGFLEWQEQFVSQEKGNRVVHYYLKDSAGDSILAVVGTERSVRHMIYVVSEEFLQAYGSENSITANFKWRSKREVVDWLTSLLSKNHPPQNCSKSPKVDSIQALRSPSFSIDGLNAPGTHLRYPMSRFSRKLKGHNSDIVWSGDAWTCGKQLRHYPAFCRNKTVIAIHSFVLVMAKEEKHYLAYLEDMYEDRKGHKKVKVRWFHDNQEVEGLIALPNRHPREVFLTPYVQVVSAECVDGPATVLIPEHFEKCLAILSQMYSAKVHLCFRQFRNNTVKPFDLTKLRGYFDQAILSCLEEEEEEFSHGGTIKKGVKRSRSCRGRQRFVTSHSGIRTSGPACQNLRIGSSSGRRSMIIKYVVPKLPQPFKVDEKIELLCQDSGIRGCWFRCTILQMSQKQLKVQYDDVQNEDDCGNLEEWVPAFRVATPDKLGMRSSGRLMIRPCRPPEDRIDSVLEIGAPVDAWWNDGWWEGVVTDIDFCEDHSLQVYFPGENLLSTFQRSKLRSSRDWVGNQWVDIEPKPDIVSLISAVVSPGLKLSACLTNTNGANSRSSGISRHEVPSDSKLGTVEEDMQELDCLAGSGNLSENMKWVNSERRPLNEEKGEGGDDPDADGNKGHNKDKDTTFNDDDGNLPENVKWVNSERRPWNEEKGEGGDYPDADGDKIHNEDKYTDFSDNDDDGREKVELIEDVDGAGQKCEAVDLMEVVA
ncbi:Bromo adjacent homology (BAH) domain [Macleaya cordata]|uniref:Bromo adjacent homology (BAH) domain n=1 Tax=Macleaya cordata TaxID=56857 RepID=A0A200QNF6_MACCD|nr:Bromo adjacent homology (BAH) domain [Macleaya cordata]